MAVGFAQIDAECIQRKHGPFAEPAAPSGDGRFVWVSDNRLAVATVRRVKRRISEVKISCRFAFYLDNGVAASPPSNSTEHSSLNRVNQGLNYLREGLLSPPYIGGYVPAPIYTYNVYLRLYTSQYTASNVYSVHIEQLGLYLYSKKHIF